MKCPQHWGLGHIAQDIVFSWFQVVCQYFFLGLTLDFLDPLPTFWSMHYLFRPCTAFIGPTSGLLVHVSSLVTLHLLFGTATGFVNPVLCFLDPYGSFGPLPYCHDTFWTPYLLFACLHLSRCCLDGVASHFVQHLCKNSVPIIQKVCRRSKLICRGSKRPVEWGPIILLQCPKR